MDENNDYLEFKEYINNLRLMKSEVANILEEGDEMNISRAAKHFPVELNHLLVKRNIKSARAIFPFADLAVIQERDQDIQLLDLNTPRDKKVILESLILRIEQEFWAHDVE